MNPMMIPAIAGAAGSLLGGIFGDSEQQQLNQQQKLQDQQIQGAKQLADYSQQKQQENWDNTNYEAQMQHMKNAGLNPALMYGQGGGGGQTMGGGAVPTPTGGQAASSAQTTEAGISKGLMIAQTANLVANTMKTTAEAKKIAGVDTDLGNTQVASLTQGIENAKAQQELTNIETKIKSFESAITGATVQQTIERIGQESLKAEQDARMAMTEANIAEETQEQKIKIIKQAAIAGVLQNALTESNTEVNKAQINKWTNEIIQKYSEIGLQQRGLDQKDRGLDQSGIEAVTQMLKTATSDETLRNLNGLYKEDALKTIEEILKRK